MAEGAIHGVVLLHGCIGTGSGADSCAVQLSLYSPDKTDFSYHLLAGNGVDGYDDEYGTVDFAPQFNVGICLVVLPLL